MHKILFVESGTSGGGSFESLYQFLKVIDRKKFTPVVVFINKTRFQSLIQNMGIVVYYVFDFNYSNRVPFFVRNILGEISFQVFTKFEILTKCYLPTIHYPLIRSIGKIIRREKIELVYLNDQINRDLFGVIICKKQKLPCISHLRSMDGRTFNRVKAKMANQYVSFFISNSETTKYYWEKCGIHSEKNHVVYNAVTEVSIPSSTDFLKKWDIDKEQFVVGCVGRLVPLKGHLFLLRSFKKLMEKYSNCMLLIVGDGPERRRLQSEAHALGIHQNVVFTGYLDNAKEIMGQLDLLVLPSRYDSFGRVLLEAMQQQTPVIGSDLYGIREIIDHNENGILVPYDDDTALFSAMERILTDREFVSRLKKNAMKTVKNKFNIESYKQNIENLITSVLEERKAN